MSCLDEDAVLRFLEEDPTATERAAVEEHLADCESCRRLLSAAVKALDDGERSAVAELGPGIALGRYVLLRPLGRGAFGEVYSAYDPDLDRKVAIKLLSAQTDSAVGNHRLLREGRAMARLSHPNVVGVYDVGVHGRTVFIAMEHVDGETAAQWLQRPYPWRAVRDVFVQAARGLEAAHALGIVHRDFKPDNVLIGTDGVTRVGDFGLAKVRERDADVCGPSTVKGTPAYMAPEQLSSRSPTAATDQFAFGVALYTALFGVRPFAGDTLDELAANVMAGRVGSGSPPATGDFGGSCGDLGAPAVRGAPRVPRWLRRAVERMLEVNPGDRYPSMKFVVRGLEGPRARVVPAAVAGALAVGLVLAVSLGIAERAPSPCGVPGRATAAFGPERRAALERALLDRGGDPQQIAPVTRQLAAYAGSWASLYTTACEATQVHRAQSAQLLDLKIACLERALRSASAVVSGLIRFDDVEQAQALEVVFELPPIARCADAMALTSPVAPPDDADRRQVETIRAEIDEIAALNELGHLAEAEQRTTALKPRVVELDYPVLTGELYAVIGRVQEQMDRFEQAEQAYLEALWSAERGNDIWIKVRAAADLASLLSQRRTDYDGAERMLRLAEASATRVGGAVLARVLLERGTLELVRTRYREAARVLERAAAVDLEVTEGRGRSSALIQHTLGAALCELGRCDEGLDRYERAVRLTEQLEGPHSRTLAAVLGSMAEAANEHGQYEQAHRLAERALAIWRKHYGDDHTAVAMARLNVGVALAALGRLEEASEQYAMTNEVYEQRLAGSMQHARVLNNLGAVAYERGRLEEGARYFERAHEIREARLEPGHADLALSHTNLAEVAFSSGRDQEALEHYDRAMEIWQGKLAADHPLLAYPLTGIGLVHLRAGKPERWLAPLQRALEIREVRPGDPEELARTRFALARALWPNRPEERGRAADLARKARDWYQEANKPDVRVVAAWLQRVRE